MRILFGFVWGILFWFIGCVVFGLMAGAANFDIGDDNILAQKIFGSIFIFSWIIVVPMTYFEKLPGTVRKKKCFYCKEEIRRDALICRFCKSKVSGTVHQSSDNDEIIL